MLVDTIYLLQRACDERLRIINDFEQQLQQKINDVEALREDNQTLHQRLDEAAKEYEDRLTTITSLQNQYSALETAFATNQQLLSEQNDLLAELQLANKHLISTATIANDSVALESLWASTLQISIPGGSTTATERHPLQAQATAINGLSENISHNSRT